jgi:hypothetical protein
LDDLYLQEVKILDFKLQNSMIFIWEKLALLVQNMNIQNGVLPLYCLPNLYALVVTNFYTTNDVREKATF